MLDSLVRVSRRVAYDHYASILATRARSSVQAGRMTPWAITLPEGSHIPKGLSPTAQTDAGLTSAECTGEEHRLIN
jgi:hypothetical protein